MKRIKGTLFLLTAVLTLTLAACGTSEPAPAPEDEAAAAQTENTESAVQFGAVKADGFLMDYFRFGEGEKTLVILPGLSVKSILLSAEGVAAGFRPYTEDYTTYVFDRPKDPPAGYSIRDLARDTAEAFDRLGLRDVDLYGASMGPMIGQVLAMERPDLVHKLVMGSTAARSGERSDGAMAAWIALAEQGDLEGLAARFGQDVYSEDFYRQYADQILASVEGADEEDLDRFVTYAKAIQDFDVYDDLDQIRCPVLVLGADEDKLFGAEGPLEIRDKLGCDCYIYEGYAHAVYDEAPDFLDRVFAFFAE